MKIQCQNPIIYIAKQTFNGSMIGGSIIGPIAAAGIAPLIYKRDSNAKGEPFGSLNGQTNRMSTIGWGLFHGSTWGFIGGAVLGFFKGCFDVLSGNCEENDNEAEANNQNLINSTEIQQKEGRKYKELNLLA